MTAPLPWPQEPIARRGPVPLSEVWFADEATAAVLRFFVPKRRSRSRFFVFGGCFFTLFFLWIIAALCVTYAAAVVASVGLVWALQLLVLTGWCVYWLGWKFAHLPMVPRP